MNTIQDTNLGKLPTELYNGDETTKVHERGLRGFAMLYQYLELFNTLERIGLNTTDVTLFRVLIQQVLTDTCHWVSLLVAARRYVFTSSL